MAACFSIYAYQALKDELEICDEFRFIFTSPTFVAEKTPKERREFYIPRLNREKSLYGTEFEVRLRNELKQKAVAKECADWMHRKAESAQTGLSPYVRRPAAACGISQQALPHKLDE